MGDVIVVLKVLPESPEQFEAVKKSCEELHPAKLEEDPIAFGLKALRVTVIIPDKAGAIDELENKVSSIPHVTTVETLMVSRSL